MPSPYGRAGIARSGFNYQDLIALELMVDFLEHQKRFEWILLEADDAGSLDDIVVQYKDGRRFYKQVKFTGYSSDPKYAFDLEELTQSSGRSKSLLRKWYDSLKKIQNNASNFEGSLETNRQISTKLSYSFSPSGILDFDKLSIEEQELILSQLPNEDETRWFFSKFRFNTNLPDSDELLDSIERRFYNRHVTEKGWLNILSELRKWVLKKNEPKPDGKITLSVIKKACLWDDLNTVSQNFPFPSDFVIPSTTFHNHFLNEVMDPEMSPVVLYGNPGTGKSTYLSNLYATLKAQGKPVLRYHYFLSNRNYNPDRLNSHLVKESLMAELKVDFPDLNIYSKRLSSNDFIDWITEVGNHFSQQNQILTIIIDGLDHVSREYQSKEELDRVFRYLMPPRPGLKIVIGTQPLVDDLIPSSLSRWRPKKEWLKLPLFDLDATKLWLRKHIVHLSLPDSSERHDFIIDDYAERLYEKCKGHPLFLHYFIQKIIDNNMLVTYEYLNNYNVTIDDDLIGYYRSLIDILSEESKHVLCLYALTPFTLKDNYLIGCLSPLFVDAIKIEKSLREVLFLLNDVETGRRIHHDSLRMYIKNNDLYKEKNIRVKKLLLEWLNERAPSYIKWGYYWTLKSDLGDSSLLIKNVHMDWVQESLNKFYPIEEIIRIINSAIRVTLYEENLPKSISFGYLRDYLIYAKEFRSEIVDVLFKSHIFLDQLDEVLLNSYMDKIYNLSNTQILDLNKSSKLNARQKETLYNELFERQKGNRLKNGIFRNDSDEDLISLLKIAPTFDDLQIDSYIKFFNEISDESAQLRYFGVYCKSACINGNSNLLLHLINQDITSDMLIIALRYAILLSFNEKYELPVSILKSVKTPLSSLYQYLTQRVCVSSEEIECPSVDIFNLSPREMFVNKSKISRAYYDILYYFIVNQLSDNEGANNAYISNVFNYWVKLSLTALDNLSKYVSSQLIENTVLDISYIFECMEQIIKPTWQYNRDNVDYSESLESVLHTVSIDFLRINELYATNYMISQSQIKKMYSYQYFDPMRWFEHLTQYPRVCLLPESINWVHSVHNSDDVIMPFTELTSDLSILSVLFAKCGNFDLAMHYISRSNQNIICYGDRKDVRLFYVLNVLELAFEHGMAEAKNWLKKIIPPIIYVEYYTDGSETEHLRKYLANILVKYLPEWFVAFYHFCLCNEQYRFIDDIFSFYVSESDLTDNVNKILLESIVDISGIGDMIKRKEEGNEDANQILESVLNYLGGNIVNVIEEKRDEYSSSPGSLVDREYPVIADFPPNKLGEYIVSFSSSLGLRHQIDDWIEYWVSQGKSSEVLENMYDQISRGVNIEAYDRVFELTVSIKGKTEAYPWLILAQKKSNSWYSRWENETVTNERWEKVKLYYPERWYDFIVKSLSDYKIRDYEYLSTDMHENIVKYCLYMNQFGLAESIIKEMVYGILPIVGFHYLPKMDWVNELE